MKKSFLRIFKNFDLPKTLFSAGFDFRLLQALPTELPLSFIRIFAGFRGLPIGERAVALPNRVFLTVFSLDYYEFKWSKLRILSAKPDFVGQSHVSATAPFTEFLGEKEGTWLRYP